MSTTPCSSPRIAKNCRTLLLMAAVPGFGLFLAPDPSVAGFHAGLGFGAGHFDLSPRLESGLAEGGVRLDPDGSGGQLRIGYSFNPHLQLDLVMAGLDLTSGDPDLQSGYGEARIELLSYLPAHDQVRPYLAGSIGGAGLGIERDGKDDETIEGSVASFGGGLDVRLSRHWSLGFDYRYGVVDFDRKEIALPLREVVLDGTATSHTWGTRFEFGF